MTRAVFQASGSCPEVYDCWKMWCIMGDISFAVSFSTFAGISSGPEALLGFRACSCFVTPFSPISRDWIDGNGDGPLVGIGSCSLVKTALK